MRKEPRLEGDGAKSVAPGGYVAQVGPVKQGDKRGASPLEGSKRKKQRIEGPLAIGTGKDKGADRDLDSTPSASPITPDFSDQYFTEAKALCADKAKRTEYFPDPDAVRGVRMWSGEDTTANAANFDAVLPVWADNHRPFSPWVQVSTLDAIHWTGC